MQALGKTLNTWLEHACSNQSNKSSLFVHNNHHHLISHHDTFAAFRTFLSHSVILDTMLDDGGYLEWKSQLQNLRNERERLIGMKFWCSARFTMKTHRFHFLSLSFQKSIMKWTNCGRKYPFLANSCLNHHFGSCSHHSLFCLTLCCSSFDAIFIWSCKACFTPMLLWSTFLCFLCIRFTKTNMLLSFFLLSYLTISSSLSPQFLSLFNFCCTPFIKSFSLAWVVDWFHVFISSFMFPISSIDWIHTYIFTL